MTDLTTLLTTWADAERAGDADTTIAGTPGAPRMPAPS